MGYLGKPNGSDFTIVTDVLQYSVFATLGIDGYAKGDPLYLLSGLLSDYYGPD